MDDPNGKWVRSSYVNAPNPPHFDADAWWQWKTSSTRAHHQGISCVLFIRGPKDLILAEWIWRYCLTHRTCGPARQQRYIQKTDIDLYLSTPPPGLDNLPGIRLKCEWYINDVLLPIDGEELSTEILIEALSKADPLQREKIVQLAKARNMFDENMRKIVRLFAQF